MIAALEALRAWFPLATTITVSLHGGRTSLLVQHDEDEHVIAAANALGAAIRAVSYKMSRWIEATGNVLGVEVSVIGPHHPVAAALPEVILPAALPASTSWRPADAFEASPW